MKKLFAIAVLLSLAACASNQSVQVTTFQQCTVYQASMHTAIDRLEAGKLNQSQILTLQKIDANMAPICTKEPVDSASATAAVTAAITTLTVEVLATKVTK